jgi:hypothetical protein
MAKTSALMEELMQVPNGNQRITALSSPLPRTLQPRFVIRTVDSNAGGLGYFGANDPASGSVYCNKSEV